MTAFLLIGVAGAAGAGKDTIGDLLRGMFDIEKMSFSDGLYREVAAAYNLPETLFRTRCLKEKRLWPLALNHCADMVFVERVRVMSDAHDGRRPRSPRWVLQRWGTEYRRAQNPEYWIEQADARLAARTSPRDMCNVSIRFPNERAWLDRNGGHLIHVHRPGVAPLSAYISERPLPVRPGDSVVHNNGTLDDLAGQLRAVMARLAAARA